MPKRRRRATGPVREPSLDRSLQQLERDDWGDPDDPKVAPTPLISTCLRLRRKPLGDLTVEDLRILLGQQVSPAHLLPLAIDQLRADPLAQGDLYPGDLLSNVLSQAPEVWTARPDLRAAMDGILERAIARLDTYSSLDATILDRIERFLDQAPGVR
jgi:hypothetical protein